LKPWVILPAGLAHGVSPFFLNFISRFCRDPQPEWQPVTWKGLKFRNPVGIAGGVDKNAKNLKAWSGMGYGFLEVGTITARPQKPNPGKTVARDWKSQALWNKLGFPNDGCAKIKVRLQQFEQSKVTPLFVNIGKNRDTPNAQASEDYIYLIRELHTLADAFVINISSPNTQDLRDLLKKENLKSFLSPIVKAGKIFNSKILLKLSPDMSQDEISNTIEVSLNLDVEGWILTNSTIERESNSRFPQDGGVTGQPLKVKSRNFLRNFVAQLGGRKDGRLIVSVGGILDSQEMQTRLNLGADLVQVYSGLIFNGPSFVKFLRQGMTQKSN